MYFGGSGYMKIYGSYLVEKTHQNQVKVRGIKIYFCSTPLKSVTKSNPLFGIAKTFQTSL